MPKMFSLVVHSIVLANCCLALSCGPTSSSLFAGQNDIEVFRLKLSTAALNAFSPEPQYQSFNLEDFANPGDQNKAVGTANAKVNIEILPVLSQSKEVSAVITANRMQIDQSNVIILLLRANYAVKADYQIHNNQRGNAYNHIGTVKDHEFEGTVDTVLFLKGDGPVDQRILMAAPYTSGSTTNLKPEAHFVKVRTGSLVENVVYKLYGDKRAYELATANIPTEARSTFKKLVPPAVAAEVSKQLKSYLSHGNNGFAQLLRYLTEENKLPGRLELSSTDDHAYFSIYMDGSRANQSTPLTRQYSPLPSNSDQNGHMSLFVHESLLNSFFQENLYTKDYVSQSYFANIFTGKSFNQQYTEKPGVSNGANIKFNSHYPKFVKIEDGSIYAHVAAQFKAPDYLRTAESNCNEDNLLLRVQMQVTNKSQGYSRGVQLSIPDIRSTSLMQLGTGVDWNDALSLLETGRLRDTCQRVDEQEAYKSEEVGVEALTKVAQNLGGIAYTTPRKVLTKTAEMFLLHNHTSITNYIPFGVNHGSDALLQPNSSARNGWLSLHWNMGDFVENSPYHAPKELHAGNTAKKQAVFITPNREKHKQLLDQTRHQQNLQPATQPKQAPASSFRYANDQVQNGNYSNKSGGYAYPGTHQNDQNSWRR